MAIYEHDWAAPATEGPVHIHNCRDKYEHEILAAIAAIQNLISGEEDRLRHPGDIGITGLTLIRIKLHAYEECLSAVTEALR